MDAELTSTLVPISALAPYPDNPRQGDVGAIVESLEALGQYRPIIVNRREDAATYMTVLAGNHTMRAAAFLGWEKIGVHYVDVDDDTAARIVLVDNRTNDLASYDEAALAELLLELQETESGLAGTGYDEDSLDNLMSDLETSLAEELGDTTLPSANLDRIPFRFGDYSGVVERSVYDRFETAYKKELDDGALLLSDVLERWLP